MIEISAIFFDDWGRTVGHESGGISPTTIGRGDKSDFALHILDEAIKSNGTTMTLPLNGKMNTHLAILPNRQEERWQIIVKVMMQKGTMRMMTKTINNSSMRYALHNL